MIIEHSTNYDKLILASPRGQYYKLQFEVAREKLRLRISAELTMIGITPTEEKITEVYNSIPENKLCILLSLFS